MSDYPDFGRSDDPDFSQMDNPFASPQDADLIFDSAEDAREEELRAFVGPRSNYYLASWAPRLPGSTARSGWNWAAWFFSGFWLLYRKMYKGAAIFFGAVLAVSIAEEAYFRFILEMPELESAMDRVLNFVPGIICGLYGNAWYLSHANRAISKVHAEMPNDDVLDALAKRGGTSFVSALGIPLVFVIATFVLVGLYAQLPGAE